MIRGRSAFPARRGCSDDLPQVPPPDLDGAVSGVSALDRGVQEVRGASEGHEAEGETLMPASAVKQAFWMVAGYLLLIIPCLAHAWEPCESTINPFGRAPRTISRWKTPWPAVTRFLNDKYGNREDGLGAEALIWPNPAQPGAGPLGDGRVLYMPDKDKPKWLPHWLYAAARAWCWSAWRN